VINLDELWKKSEYNLNCANRDRNTVLNDLKQRKKANKEDKCEELLLKKTQLEEDAKKFEKEAAELLKKRDYLLNKIGNLVHDSVPVHNNEDFNGEVRKWGEPNRIQITEKPGACHHH
jgi:seryl-tRNA synthetase